MFAKTPPSQPSKGSQPSPKGSQQYQKTRAKTTGRKSRKTNRSSRGRKSGELQHQDLEKLPYYHGLLTREDIEELLEGDDKDGQFVVRLTQLNKRRNISISVRWKKENRHYIVKTTGKGPELKYFIEADQKFTSIHELVEFYLKNKKHINDHEGPKLVTPLPRQTWELAHDQITYKEKLGEGQTDIPLFPPMNLSFQAPSGKSTRPYSVTKAKKWT